MRCPRLIPLLGLLVACDNGKSPAAQPEKTTESTRKLAGVYPEKFTCDSVTTLEALRAALGGGAVHQMDNAMSVPRGVPQPCNYGIETEAGTQFWTYDIDCRDGMKQRADALFAQYRTDSAQKVQEYNQLSDAGALKPSDAGIAIRAPEDAVEVAVGAKALDHHGQGLIFIDDDAPCYVRVVGPDAAHRLELAKLVAKNLTFANAPMTPRPMP